MSKDYFEQVSSDKSQLGFDYQDLVCLEYLLDLKPGEKIGLEVLDDVHHEQIRGATSLIQVKHSVSEGSSLTNRDIDLWKTIYNWSKALVCLNGEDVEFVFFTNKKKTSQSGIVQLIDSEHLNLTEVIETISEIKEDLDLKESVKKRGEKENPIKKYVDHIYDLSDEKKRDLFDRIRMVFSTDDIFKRLAEKVEFFSIRPSDTHNVIYMLIGVFGEQKYKLIKSSQKVEIDYEMFRKNFQFNRIINMSADRKVDFSRYHQFKNVNTIDPKDGLFAKQLVDIDISQEDITEHAIEYAATSMYIQKLIVDGQFSETENEAINEEVFYAWKALHNQLYNQDGIDTDEKHKRVARDCLYKVEDIPVQVSNSALARPMVTGKGLELSDMCRIGWRKDWKELYGVKK
ncbi:ABC-three component system protein [Microbulbifer sp. VAAF005]|uniref:ABC-three component system protein n=1 Tax=Microbulbifer sp. VAAF005 TaxID=3034230 RepID=UPI0024AD1297|nr:ABC-three component system protein [Microbulbifer sp. VAAF005]WHI46953.1 hypothetical protein P0078_00855 [Microbulbifer sp. VAAF005]